MKLIDANGKKYRGRIGITNTIIVFIFSALMFISFIIIMFYSCSYEWDEYVCESVIDTVDLLKSSLVATDFDEDTINDDNNVDNIFVRDKIKSAANSIYIKYVYLLKVQDDNSLKLVYSAKHEFIEGDRVNPDYTISGIKYGYEEIANGNLVLNVDDLALDDYYKEMEADNPYFLSTILYRPMYTDDEQKELVGFVCADSNASMLVFLTLQLVLICILVGFGIFILIMFVFIFFSNLILTKPIRALAKAANEESKVENKRLQTFGNLKIKSKNEIGYLASSMKNMEKNINELMDKNENEAKERERIEASLDIAAEIQRTQLPEDFPLSRLFDVYAIMKPAKEVAGDYYDVEMLDDDHLYMLIADVSDKGIPAAMFMAISKIYFNVYAHRIADSPAKIIEEANAQLVKNNKIGMFVTVWIGILEISTGKMICANAGHEYPLIKRAGGKYEIFEDKHDLFVATMPGIKYHDYEIQLNKGDELLVYTDGAPEAKNEEGKLLSLEEFVTMVNDSYDSSAVNMVKNIEAGIKEYRGNALQYDDITLLNFKYNK